MNFKKFPEGILLLILGLEPCTKLLPIIKDQEPCLTTFNTLWNA